MVTPPLVDRRITKSVAVRTDAEGALNLNLRFSVNVVAPIVFQPSNRLVVSTIEGEEGLLRVLLHRVDGKPLKILAADTGNPSLSAVAVPVTENENRDGLQASPGDLWLELVLAANATVGSRTGSLRLETNHPVASSFAVPYAMRVRPLLESRPAGARLWTSPSGGGDGASSILTLSRSGGGDFSITAISVSDPEIFTAAAIPGEPGPRQMVRVGIADGVGPETLHGTLEGWIEITTDIPDHPTHRLPVLVASSREGTRRGFRAIATAGALTR